MSLALRTHVEGSLARWASQSVRSARGPESKNTGGGWIRPLTPVLRTQRQNKHQIPWKWLYRQFGCEPLTLLIADSQTPNPESSRAADAAERHSSPKLTLSKHTVNELKKHQACTKCYALQLLVEYTKAGQDRILGKKADSKPGGGGTHTNLGGRSRRS